MTVKKTVAPPTLKKAPGAPKKVVLTKKTATVQKKPKATLRGKGAALKKKKETRKMTIDCTHPVEDSIMDVNNFVRIHFKFDSFIFFVCILYNLYLCIGKVPPRTNEV